MNALTALHELIRRLLAYAIEVDANFFRPAKQRAPAGPANQPYATVYLYDTALVGYDLGRYAPDDSAVADVVPDGVVTDLVEVIDSIESVTASVQFWRDGVVDGAGRPAWGLGALDRASRLVKRLELSSVVEQANAYGIGYTGAGQVRDLTAVVDGAQEGRAQVDLTFYFTAPELAAINMFKSASFDVKVQQPDGYLKEVTA